MRFTRKIPTFVFGLSIGLLVGVGFFVFKINDIFNKMKDSAKSQITVIEQPIKNSSKEEAEKNKNKERFKINLHKTNKVNYSEADSLIKDNSEINIATDELLSIKNVKIIRISPTFPNNDSLVADIAGVKTNNSDLYFVEFWKTPLNTKGYRFSKNKILLYGFVDYNNVTLYELDNSYYIKASDKVYKIFYGADFKSLERVVDSELLAKIN
ncbi:MAG: hypothetical protein Q7W45_18420 [Bacteroidota bacterium]|nr:hypothetical protein [Bacteroidota bacterium]MDP3145617.1 hypothetical protein [Bacteroidota bacterium]MDP3558710.1 hypothetical protein [Bacteroidota bacterium]